MSSLRIFLLATTLLMSSTAVQAEADLQSSRSAGKLKADQSQDLSQVIKQVEPIVRARPTEAENFAASSANQQLAGVANRHDQLFEIYTADVELLADLDGDGFHHALNVYFDVDVNYDSATVYAKLYLSRNGGPWSQFFTTDLFLIHLDDFSDTYEVETELIDGYDPGYYEVLVEIYSLDHAYLVASEVLDYHYLGRDIALEDLYWDEPYYDSHGEVSLSFGAGDFTSLLLFFLIIQVVIAARGFLALSPCKKSDNNNYKKRVP